MKGVITGDWHIRKDSPTCRPEDDDEWMDFQFGQVVTVMQFCIAHNLNMYNTGDLFDKSQPWYGVVGRLRNTLRLIEKNFFKLAGNHDLPYHCWDNAFNSGWYSAPGIDITEKWKGSFHFGTEPKNKDAKIIFTHQLTFPDKKSMPPHTEGKTAAELLKEYPNADWIFLGDYHKHFHYEKNGRHVVNPGCLTRQKASEENYEVGFYEVDTKANKVVFHRLTDDVDMVLDYLEVAKATAGRLEVLMNKIESTEVISLSYRDNLHAKLGMKAVTKGMKSILTEIEEEIEIGVKK